MSNEVVSRPGTPPMSFDDLFTNPTGTPARKSTTEKDTDNKPKTKPPSFDNWMKTASAHATFPKGGKKTRKRSRSKRVRRANIKLKRKHLRDLMERKKNQENESLVVVLA